MCKAAPLGAGVEQLVSYYAECYTPFGASQAIFPGGPFRGPPSPPNGALPQFAFSAAVASHNGLCHIQLQTAARWPPPKASHFRPARAYCSVLSRNRQSQALLRLPTSEPHRAAPLPKKAPRLA